MPKGQTRLEQDKRIEMSVNYDHGERNQDFDERYHSRTCAENIGDGSEYSETARGHVRVALTN
ncbi:hypothetical protein SARC_02853 [Sphaeroforma arctica JP610]|uniref:Uncharacterized protein n=1 Tax=Sphaeroforma arctica JP610 TaxID=667725 RepID=A0A0L0G7E9_9EUKA|nr:hypothetical protein SARC_02853 [Sphaeroforma arctica JP610]KNC84930.1 hypothetical protein SARC_02853 [Sphaeroforma arctica JP610]|eukprot:XP_014158832.1 hypothetical protein SARC_02853 [Sphaeroforma arctica JP610]